MRRLKALVTTATAAVAAVVGLLILAMALILGLTAFGGAIPGMPGGGCAPAAAEQPAASGTAKSIPANYLALYRKAGSESGIPWNVLAAVGQTESDHGRGAGSGIRSGENYAGAGGPMQFLKATWDAFAVDGDKDGDKDRYDPVDAIPSAAAYLKHNGAPKRMRNALYRYNHSWDYVNLVLARAKSYAAPGGFDVADPPAAAGTADCPAGPGFIVPATGRAAIAVKAALRWVGTPYSWGGGSPSGPTYGIQQGTHTKGFDCSSLMQYAWHQAGVTLPRVAADQSRARNTVAVPPAQIAPGDLVFRAGYTGDPRNPGHVGMFIGNGKVVEAPGTGDVVKVVPYATHWKSKIVAIRRPVASR